MVNALCTLVKLNIQCSCNMKIISLVESEWACIEVVKVGGRLMKTLRAVVDQAILAGSQKRLQNSMDRLNHISTKYHMKINILGQRS